MAIQEFYIGAKEVEEEMAKFPIMVTCIVNPHEFYIATKEMAYCLWSSNARARPSSKYGTKSIALMGLLVQHINDSFKI